MKYLLLFCSISFLIMQANAQSTRKTRTITTSFSKQGTTSGDTAFFSYDDQRGHDLTRFFNRNLRMPIDEETMEQAVGSCNLYFMVDKAGTVIKSWCDSVTNTVVEKEILRVAGLLKRLQPTTIKGKPVITKVVAKVIMVHGRPEDVDAINKNLKADLIVIGYGTVRKKAIGR